MNFVFEYGGSAGATPIETVLHPIGVLSAADAGGTIEITEREYAAGAAGAMAIIDDVRNLLDWDTLPDAGAYVGNFYKGDAGMQITPSGTYPVGSLLCQQGTLSVAFGANNGTSFAQHVVIAKWDGGFCICFPDAADVWTNGMQCVGIAKCTNAATGEDGWCGFYHFVNSSTDYVYIGSQSTSGTSMMSMGIHDADAFPALVTAHPLYTIYSADTPDGLLFLICAPDASAGIPELGFCEFIGQLWYRVGRVLIPAE